MRSPISGVQCRPAKRPTTYEYRLRSVPHDYALPDSASLHLAALRCASLCSAALRSAQGAGAARLAEPRPAKIWKLYCLADRSVRFLRLGATIAPEYRCIAAPLGRKKLSRRERRRRKERGEVKVSRSFVNSVF